MYNRVRGDDLKMQTELELGSLRFAGKVAVLNYTYAQDTNDSCTTAGQPSRFVGHHR